MFVWFFEMPEGGDKLCAEGLRAQENKQKTKLSDTFPGTTEIDKYKTF